MAPRALQQLFETNERSQLQIRGYTVLGGWSWWENHSYIDNLFILFVVKGLLEFIAFVSYLYYFYTFYPQIFTFHFPALWFVLK